jgi:hypothetical protein
MKVKYLKPAVPKREPPKVRDEDTYEILIWPDNLEDTLRKAGLI